MSTSKFCEVQERHEYHKNCLAVTPLGPEAKPEKVKREVTREEREQRELMEERGGRSKLPTFLGKQTVRYMSTDGVRVLLLPSKEPNYYPIKISAEELERLKQQATVSDEKDRLKMVEDIRREQTRLEHESAVRKNELKQYDKKGKGGGTGRLSALEREARDKANYLLKRAWELRHEDDDDVKKANSLILQVKCQAIRDAQLAEHKLIAKEMKEEEKRIEQMMEDERLRSYWAEKVVLEREKAKKERYVMELNQQMEEIEARRLLDAELLVEERRKTNEAMFVLMLEELEEVKKREEEKRKTRELLTKANEQVKRAQEIEREEEKICELRVQEYMRMKAEREEQFEREKEAERKRKELEYARQRALQEKSLDLQAIQDEMNAVRRQEEYEREWRKKEREAAKKKLKMEEDCRLGREQQIRDNLTFQAMEISREKREFERNLQVQLELQEKERLLDLKRKHNAEAYREAILKQINQKEKERIEERQEKFQEGLAMKAEEAKRKAELRQILDKKIEIIRANKVPEVYISDLQRQFNLTLEH